MGAFLVVLVPVVLTYLIGKQRSKKRQLLLQQAVTVSEKEVGGEKGLTKRNARFKTLVEKPREGADTLAVLFEQACAEYASNRCLGARILVSRETEVGADGRAFEKVTLGPYVWTSYGQAFLRASDLASGLVAIGHERGERVAIFAETRPEWFLALQVTWQCPST